MVRRKFSLPPKVSSNSKASVKLRPGEVPSEVTEFKNTYVHERSILERFRTGNKQEYVPATSLDGHSLWNTPETKQLKNVWHEEYQRVAKLQQLTTPAHYVRILFRILRGSSLSIPTPRQLSNSQMLGLVVEYIQDQVDHIREQFVAESKRATVAIRINQRGAGYSMALSVYYALVDSRLELSPLFKYCLATGTVDQIGNGTGVDNTCCDKLSNLAKRNELLAAMDYTLFPSHYDQVWGTAIPSAFRIAAHDVLRSALNK